MSSILGDLVTHTKSIQFQIIIDKYLNNEKLTNRIFEYIQFWKIYESNIRIYSDISKLRIKYSNIFVWSKLNIRIRILDIRRTTFEFPNIFEYSFQSCDSSIGYFSRKYIHIIKQVRSCHQTKPQKLSYFTSD